MSPLQMSVRILLWYFFPSHSHSESNKFIRQELAQLETRQTSIKPFQKLDKNMASSIGTSSPHHRRWMYTMSWILHIQLFHCLIREGFGPFSWAMNFYDKICLGLFLVEIQSLSWKVAAFIEVCRKWPQSKLNPRRRGILLDHAVHFAHRGAPRISGLSHSRGSLHQRIHCIICSRSSMVIWHHSVRAFVGSCFF